MFPLCYPEQAVEQTVELQVIWDAKTENKKHPIQSLYPQPWYTDITDTIRLNLNVTQSIFSIWGSTDTALNPIRYRLSYHSQMDPIVKRFFSKILTVDPQTPITFSMEMLSIVVMKIYSKSIFFDMAVTFTGKNELWKMNWSLIRQTQVNCCWG